MSLCLPFRETVCISDCWMPGKNKNVALDNFCVVKWQIKITIHLPWSFIQYRVLVSLEYIPGCTRDTLKLLGKYTQIAKTPWFRTEIGNLFKHQGYVQTELGVAIKPPDVPVQVRCVRNPLKTQLRGPSPSVVTVVPQMCWFKWEWRATTRRCEATGFACWTTMTRLLTCHLPSAAECQEVEKRPGCPGLGHSTLPSGCGLGDSTTRDPLL